MEPPEHVNVQIAGTEMRDVGHVADILLTPKYGGVVSAMGNGVTGPITSLTGTTEEPLGEREVHGKKMVGDYVILSSLGAGSFAVVYLAKHRRTLQTVAIKSIYKEKLVARKLVENLEGEINITRSFHHQNIVELYDVIKTERSFYLVLEHCGGGDLHKFLKKHERLSEATTRHFMCQLAAGLLFLRANGLMHRDLKPQNLLLSSDSIDATLKIADFGFARVLTEATMTDTLCGSPQYMAPEIMQGRQYDAKADLWSVGMILYECVVGKTPFRGRNQMELLRNIMVRPLTIPSSLDISPGCKSIVKMLLKAGPELRCSYEEFFSHKWIGLEQALQQQQQQQQQVPSQSSLRKIRGMHRLSSLPEEAIRKTVVHSNPTRRRMSDADQQHEAKELIDRTRLLWDKPNLAHPKFNTAPSPPLLSGDTSPLQHSSGLSSGKHDSLDRGHSPVSSFSNNSSEPKSRFAMEGAVNSPPTPLLLRAGSSMRTRRGHGLSNLYYEFKPLMPSPPQAQINEGVAANMFPPLNLDASVHGTDSGNNGGNQMQSSTLYSGIEDYVIVDEYLEISPRANAKLTKQTQNINANRYAKVTATTVPSQSQKQLPRVSGVGLSPKGGSTGSGGSYPSSPQQLAASVVSDMGNVEVVGKRAVVLAQLGDANVVAALEVLHAGYITSHVEAALFNGVYCSLKENADKTTADDGPQVPGQQHPHSNDSEVLKDSSNGGGILPNQLDICFGLDLYDPIIKNAGFKFHHEKENQCPVLTKSDQEESTGSQNHPSSSSYEHSDDVSQAATKLLADAFVLYLKSLGMMKAMILLGRKGLEALETGKELLFSHINWNHDDQVTSWGEGLLHWLSLQFMAVLDRAEQCQSKLRTHGRELSSSAIACSMKSIEYLILRGAMCMGKEAILVEALGQSKRAMKQLKKACLLLETLMFNGSSSETLASPRGGGSNREKGGTFSTIAHELINAFHERSSKKPTVTVPTAE
eukprot:368838_1